MTRSIVNHECRSSYIQLNLCLSRLRICDIYMYEDSKETHSRGTMGTMLQHDPHSVIRSHQILKISTTLFSHAVLQTYNISSHRHHIKQLPKKIEAQSIIDNRGKSSAYLNYSSLYSLLRTIFFRHLIYQAKKKKLEGNLINFIEYVSYTIYFRYVLFGTRKSS